jgi:hypothetical protein
MLRAVDVRAKSHAVVVDLAQRRKAEHLEPAAVGQNRPLPAHKTMQPAQPRDTLVAWAQVQVVGVAQNNLEAELLQFLLAERFDRRLRADGHKHGRLHNPVRRIQPPPPRMADGRCVQDLE